VDRRAAGRRAVATAWTRMWWRRSSSGAGARIRPEALHRAHDLSDEIISGSSGVTSPATRGTASGGPVSIEPSNHESGGGLTITVDTMSRPGGGRARGALRPLHRISNRFLAAVERPFIRRRPEPLRYPPIFIVGPPRSGSTSLYLYLAAALDVTVLTNLDDVFYGAPVLVHRIAGRRLEPAITSLDSNLG